MEKELIIEVSEKKRDYTRSISEEKLSALITLFTTQAFIPKSIVTHVEPA